MYLYSNILGTFVFNQNFQIREKILFSKEESLDYLEALEEGKTIEPEKDFLAKFKNIIDLRKGEDLEKLSRVLDVLDSQKHEIKEKNEFLAKHAVRDSVQEDTMIMQCINAIEEHDKAINLLVKRLREWYSYYLPELEKQVDENDGFVAAVLETKKKDYIKKNKIEVSMGKDLDDESVSAMIGFAQKINGLIESRKEQEAYLEKIMKKNCPNLSAVAGVQIGAKLIAIAGSLRKLVLFPASTVQLLGAEKALFRHMKNKKKYAPPKYGVLHEHKYISQSPAKFHGKIARSLADKISMAAKIDFFKGEYRGDEMVAELEAKIRAIRGKV